MISHSDPSDTVVSLPGSNRTRTAALLLVLICLFIVWWKQRMPIPVPETRTGPRSFAQHRPQLPTEEEWIVGRIAWQIFETAGFAKAGKGPEVLRIQMKTTRQFPTREKPEHYQFQIKIRGKDFPCAELDLTNYLWDPANFTALAREAMGVAASPVPLPRIATDPEIFQRLVRPTPDVLIHEDKRLSEALTRHPLDAELHEEAALLVGSFALRHAADSFYDVRQELCAITAHLAIARALDKNTGPAGELAEVILLTLCGRQSAALEILQHLDHNQGTKAGLPLEANTVWDRALTMRNTGDYRKLDQPEHASLFERLEFVRAVRFSVSSEAATGFLLDYSAERLAEWTNLIMGGGFSVEDGNRWAVRALVEEMEETVAAYRAYYGSRLEENEAIAALNKPVVQINESVAERPRVEVLGWGMWAQLHQRQLCQLIASTYFYLDYLVGLPEAAKEFKAEATKRFSGLQRFPLVAMKSERDQDNATENAKPAAKLWEEKPELVPFDLWSGATSQSRGGMTRPPLQLPPQIWFEPVFPLGTLYDVAHRGESVLRIAPKTDLDRMKAIAPYNDRVLYHHMQKTWNQFPTPEQMAAQFEAISDYDAWAMEVVANGVKNDPDRYEPAFTRLCQLNPNQYLELGRYLCEKKRFEAAARAYEKAIELAPDRVSVSNEVGWLVNYYYDNNRKSEAFAVAKMAADVYSARGLNTMAQLCERANRPFDAELYFRKAAERYEHWEELALFYGRHRSEPKFEGAFERLIVKIFPDGKEPAEVAMMSGVPNGGVLLTATSPVAASSRLQKDDVVVAINGFRVRNKAQYFYQMDTSSSAEVELIVWSKQRYQLVRANLPDHRLGVEIQEFHRPKTR